MNSKNTATGKMMQQASKAYANYLREKNKPKETVKGTAKHNARFKDKELVKQIREEYRYYDRKASVRALARKYGMSYTRMYNLIMEYSYKDCLDEHSTNM